MGHYAKYFREAKAWSCCGGAGFRGGEISICKEVEQDFCKCVPRQKEQYARVREQKETRAKVHLLRAGTKQSLHVDDLSTS